MNPTVWNLFPYPTLLAGKFTPGSLLPIHDACKTCPVLQCEKDQSARVGEAYECRFGLTYSRIDDDRVVAGLVGDGLANPTRRAQKRLRNEPARRVKIGHISSAVQAAIEAGPNVARNYERDKKAVIERLSRDPELLRGIAEDLRKGFDQEFNRSHDFLQLVQIVRGNVEVLLAEAVPDQDVVSAAESHKVLGAIYFTTELMLMKMNSLRYLQQINFAYGGQQRFKLHPFILKYVRVYDWQARQKQISVHVIGECHSFVAYNPEAFSSIVQGLLDNMVKYAPAGSSATLMFEESPGQVRVSFTSLGPKIQEDEMEKIFLPGFRASAAASLETSGQGIGLAASKGVADALGIDLSVSQESAENTKFRAKHDTTFVVVLTSVL